MEDSTHIIVSMIGFFGVLVSALFGYLNHKHAKEINDAVNHRHDKAGPGAPKLYDLAWENHKKADELIQWKRGYDSGPLATGDRVVSFVSSTSDKLADHDHRIRSLEKMAEDDLLGDSSV
jgi:hypothetical protein